MHGGKETGEKKKNVSLSMQKAREKKRGGKEVDQHLLGGRGTSPEGGAFASGLKGTSAIQNERVGGNTGLLSSGMGGLGGQKKVKWREKGGSTTVLLQERL